MRLYIHIYIILLIIMHSSILSNKKNIYSQNGEDGIIDYIFSKIGVKNGNFIEFGAWDGIHLSNTYNLFKSGWSGIYIEGDSTKSEVLKHNFNNYKNITCINSMVGYSEHDNLDTLIDNSSHTNKDFDFISIDVDGLDYYIFKKMEKYLPKVICIEVNAGHSPLYDKEIPLTIAQNNIGQSLYIITKEAEKKGYFPLCYTGNLFLIQNKYKELFKDDVKTLNEIYFDFLLYLENTNPGGIKHLYDVFIIGKQYNNFNFVNQELEIFCKLYYLRNM